MTKGERAMYNELRRQMPQWAQARVGQECIERIALMLCREFSRLSIQEAVKVFLEGVDRQARQMCEADQRG